MAGPGRLGDPPRLFGFNELLVISDGTTARIGTLTAGWEWFKPWRTVSGQGLAPSTLPELQVLIEGVFDRRRVLDLVGGFIVFEDDGNGPVAKKVAGYHQFHAVRVAVAETLRAAKEQGAREVGRYDAGERSGGEPGDRRVGVVWHTQGSGKSLTMTFYAGRIVRTLDNPTVVVLTDRNDLDDEELDHAVRQIISRAVASEGVIDIFAAAGLQKPDISVLSEEFLSDVKGMPQRNLGVELLRKLLTGEIHTRRRKNVVQARSFAQMLEETLRRYQNRAIEAAQVIEELIALARDMRAASARGEQLGLTDDEVAFYDALETNDSAVQVLGDEALRTIARELVASVRANVTIDWTTRENVRANLRVIVKRILRKYGYPPDKQEKATQTVLEQAALLSQEWAVA